MSVNNQIDYIEFPADSTADLLKTKLFFSDVFGWTYQDWGPDYSDTKASGVGSGINADSDHRPSQPLVVVYAADLEKTRDKIVTANGAITKEIFSFPGGRRFHFKDPAGNEMAVWSDRPAQSDR